MTREISNLENLGYTVYHKLDLYAYSVLPTLVGGGRPNHHSAYFNHHSTHFYHHLAYFYHL